MELPAELSTEIKKKALDIIDKKGVRSKMRKMVAEGLEIAKEEIKKGIKDTKLTKYTNNITDTKELEALQRIYKYLKEKGLDWTLSVLEMETNIKQGQVNSTAPEKDKVIAHHGYSNVSVMDKEEFEENDYIVSVNDL